MESEYMPLKTILPFFQHHGIVPTSVKCFNSSCDTITWPMEVTLSDPLLKQGHPEQDTQDQGCRPSLPCCTARALLTPSHPSRTS